MRRHRITRKLLAVAVVVGALAAGGAAFTATNTLPNTVAGYGTSNISGATATAITYGLSSDGQTINSATITLTGDYHTDQVLAGFGTGTSVTCTTSYTSPNTTATCSGFSQSVLSSSTFNVSVAS